MQTIKTIIELFDECQIKNVIAPLKFNPEKIIYVGFKENMKRKKTDALEAFLKEHGLNAAVEYEIVGRYSYDYIVKTLIRLIDENSGCGFDLTGGKELVLVAMGEVAVTKNVPMFQFNIRSGNFIRIKNCEGIAEPSAVSMSIKECVSLNGGSVVRGIDDFNWKLTDDFKNDLENMWEICRNNPAMWNRNSNILAGFDKTEEDKSKLYIDVVSEKIPDTQIMCELEKCGLILKFRSENDTVEFKYKNEQVHRALAKAGNLLELYVYMLLREINGEKNAIYNDIDIGITVDWDGELNNVADTINEIDVMMMRGTLPVFVSCKNGEVHKDALYELETVADKFGGGFSKKIIVTTYISSHPESRKYILQRARDMQIDIIYDVNNMNREEFKNAIKQRTM